MIDYSNQIKQKIQDDKNLRIYFVAGRRCGMSIVAHNFASCWEAALK